MARSSSTAGRWSSGPAETVDARSSEHRLGTRTRSMPARRARTGRSPGSGRYQAFGFFVRDTEAGVGGDRLGNVDGGVHPVAATQVPLRAVEVRLGLGPGGGGRA